MKKWLKISLPFLFLLLILSIFPPNPYPSDELLEKRFYSNKTNFEKLAGMFKEDCDLFRINLEDGAWKSRNNPVNLPPDRLIKYKRLLFALKIQRITRYELEGDIYFLVWENAGFLIGGSYNYYVYTKKSPPNIVESLDKSRSSGQDANDYKKIEENWYLYLDIW